MKGKVALITGAAMGLGLVCAERFARAGATTILADIQFPEKQRNSLSSPDTRLLPANVMSRPSKVSGRWSRGSWSAMATLTRR